MSIAKHCEDAEQGLELKASLKYVIKHFWVQILHLQRLSWYTPEWRSCLFRFHAQCSGQIAIIYKTTKLQQFEKRLN